jgi:hypothetical protein
MQYDLGFFDQETGRITSAENPFGAKVLLGLNGSSKHLIREYTLGSSSLESLWVEY